MALPLATRRLAVRGGFAERIVEAGHQPVLRDRIVELLAVPGDEPAVLVDATLGAAGHATALLGASGPHVHLVGFDRDPAALELADRRLAAYRDRVTLVHAPFDDLAHHVRPVAAVHGPVLGVLYDLGVSSMQLDTPARGFSFRSFGPLDMRMDPTRGTSAADLLRRIEQPELERIIREYGEERYAGRIAAAIVRTRPLQSTLALAEVVETAIPARARHASRRAGIHPATRTFQALRIAVNGELERFSASLPQALELAAPADAQARGGRIATLSYHSLEDRIAKRFFSDAATGCTCPPDLPVCACGRVPLVRHLVRRPDRPSDVEVAANPRARSARLRVAERIAQDLRDARP